MVVKILRILLKVGKPFFNVRFGLIIERRDLSIELIDSIEDKLVFLREIVWLITLFCSKSFLRKQIEDDYVVFHFFFLACFLSAFKTKMKR
jgi:hypothetical protein